MQTLAALVQSTADFLFVPILVVVLFGAGIFLTVRLGAVQFRRFGDAVRVFFARESADSGGALSPFQAFMTALAATIGIGAGKDCDGQVLVLHDMLGVYPGKTARFVRNFMQGAASIEEAIRNYVAAVRDHFGQQ